MKYRVVITALEPNPNFEAEWKEREANSRLFNNILQPAAEKDREIKKLETVLTEAEFIAARNAILGAM